MATGSIIRRCLVAACLVAGVGAAHAGDKTAVPNGKAGKVDDVRPVNWEIGPLSKLPHATRSERGAAPIDPIVTSSPYGGYNFRIAPTLAVPMHFTGHLPEGWPQRTFEGVHFYTGQKYAVQIPAVSSPKAWRYNWIKGPIMMNFPKRGTIALVYEHGRVLLKSEKDGSMHVHYDLEYWHERNASPVPIQGHP